MLAVKMNASEPRVTNYTNENVELVEHGAEHPLGEFTSVWSVSLGHHGPSVYALR